jgi:hypothetical protein
VRLLETFDGMAAPHDRDRRLLLMANPEMIETPEGSTQQMGTRRAWKTGDYPEAKHTCRPDRGHHREISRARCSLRPCRLYDLGYQLEGGE